MRIKLNKLGKAGNSMNQIQKLNRIDKNLLNQGEYFQSLFLQMCNKKMLTQVQIERIQLELIDLLGKEVDRYTGGESSSIPVEKAQEILHSITYSIGLYLKSIKNMDEVSNVLTSDKIKSLFLKGMDAVSQLKDKAEALLNDLMKNKLIIDNFAYQDTITYGLPKFFQEYQIEFGSFDVPGSIDYPLLETITDLQGVEFQYEYLSRLTIENDFLRCFSEQKIALLLKNFNKDSVHMLINIFELVLTNALGCELTGREIIMLDIPVEERNWLNNRLKGKNKEEIAELLRISLDRIGKELQLSGVITAYAGKAISELARRIVHNLETDTLEEIFIAFEDEVQLEESFEDGIAMEDEALRELIKELGELHSVSDKLIRIRETVRNLSDLIEILQECFYSNEYEEVFNLISDTDKALLKYRIREEAGPEWSLDYKPEKEWQEIFLRRTC